MHYITAKLQAFINWSGRVLQTDMDYIAKNGFWLSVGQGIALISSFILSIVFANTLPKEIYGNYKFILSATGILGAFSLTGLGTVVTQAVARGKEGVFFDAIKTQRKWSVLVLFVSVVTAFYYLSQGNTLLFYSFLIAGVAFPITNAYGLYGSFLNGRKNFKANTVYWSISQIFSVICLIIASLLTHAVLVLIATYFITSVISTLFFYRYTIQREHASQEKDDSLISYGIHISAMNVFGTIANQLDKVLVFHYLGAAELAIYAFSLAIPEQIKGSYKNLFNLALPKYASVDRLQMRKSVVKKTLQLTSYTAILVAVYILCAPLIYRFFFPRYIESVWYSQIYSLGLIAIPAISLFGTYFQLEKKTKVLYKLMVISNTITIILTFLLISHFGLKGAVIENGISWLVIVVCYVYFFLEEKNEVLSEISGS